MQGNGMCVFSRREYEERKCILLRERKVILSPTDLLWASQVALVIKNLPANTVYVRDQGSIPGWGWQIYRRLLGTQKPFK